MVLNNENPVTCLTVDQLAQIWDARQPGHSWSRVSDLEPPFDADIERFGPGTDSGTFDYFTEAVNGEEGVQTKDYNNVGEDDNQTVTGVEGSEGGIGYFGYSYFKENEGSLKALEIKTPTTAVRGSFDGDRAGRHLQATRASAVRLSVEHGHAAAARGAGPFVQYYVDNVNDSRLRSGHPDDRDEQQSKDDLSGVVAGASGRRQVEAREARDASRPPARRLAEAVAGGRESALRREARSTGALAASAAGLGADHDRDRRLAARAPVEFFRDVPIKDFLFGTDW